MKKERGSSEESMCISGLPDALSEGVMGATSPWQFSNGAEMANHHPGYLTRDNTKSIRGESIGASCADKPSEPGQDHMMYHPHPHEMWEIDPPLPHPQEAGHGPTANGTTYQYDYSSSESHHSSHGDSYVPFSDRYPLSTLLSPSSFTPINQNNSTAPFPSSKVSRTALC